MKQRHLTYLFAVLALVLAVGLLLWQCSFDGFQASRGDQADREELVANPMSANRMSASRQEKSRTKRMNREEREKIGLLSDFVIFDTKQHRIEFNEEIWKRSGIVLEAILKQGKLPPPPADLKVEERMKLAFLNWYDADPDKALNFALGLEKCDERGRERCVLLNAMVSHVADVDFDRALELAQLHLVDENGFILIIGDLMEKAAQSGDLASRILQACQIGVSDPSAFHYQNQDSFLKYSSDFPFEATLDALADIVAGLPENGELPLYPYRMLSSWAKQDPDAAYEWLLKGKKVPGNSEFEDFMEGYKKNATEEEVATLTAQWLSHKAAHSPQVRPPNENNP